MLISDLITQVRNHTIPPPPPPPETRPQTQQAAASTSQLMSTPPPTHATANPPSRDRHKKPHHGTPHATMTTTLPPQPTPPPPSQPAPPAAAPAEPYALHNPAAVQQHLRGLGDQEVLRLHGSGTTQRIRAITLVQAATLGEGVRDFLFDAFLHVARHNPPPHAPPQTARARPSRGAGSGCPPSVGGDT